MRSPYGEFVSVVRPPPTASRISCEPHSGYVPPFRTRTLFVQGRALPRPVLDAAIDTLIGASRYPYIVAWGKWLGFKPETVRNDVVKAETDDAPHESVQKIDGRWVFLADIQNDSNRQRIIAIAGSRGN